jgi:hypothetical protein
MTPEGKVKERIKKRLRALGIRYHMPVQNGMGTPTVDFDGCIYRGWGFVIEAKAPGGSLTERQEETFQEVRNAGGAAFMIDDSAKSWWTFEEFIKSVDVIMETLDNAC